jgi:hypothetical protein
MNWQRMKAVVMNINSYDAINVSSDCSDNDVRGGGGLVREVQSESTSHTYEDQVPISILPLSLSKSL